MAPKTKKPSQPTPVPQVNVEDDFEAIAEALASEDYSKCIKTANAGAPLCVLCAPSATVYGTLSSAFVVDTPLACTSQACPKI
jgi:hypothetical protein